MLNTTRTLSVLSTTILAMFVCACDEEKPKPSPLVVASAPVVATTTATVSDAAPANPEVMKPSHECPKGSEGEGTFKKPCTAKGKERTMQVKWNGKISDQGPTFNVKNLSKIEILYGQIYVYFYDEKGKQLEVPATGGAEARPMQKCSGNIFGGPMKPGEVALLTFSCVAKQHVPEGTKQIEGELRMVGFTAPSGKKSDTYWLNEDLTPNERPKGGIK